MPNANEVAAKGLEVQQQLLEYIANNIGKVSAPAIEHYANAFAIIQSGKPAPGQVTIDVKK